MAKLENIIGGTINSGGGVDVNCRPAGFSIDKSGVVRDGYSDTGCRVTENRNIRDCNYRDTGLSIELFQHH